MSSSVLLQSTLNDDFSQVSKKLQFNTLNSLINLYEVETISVSLSGTISPSHLIGAIIYPIQINTNIILTLPSAINVFDALQEIGIAPYVGLTFSFWLIANQAGGTSLTQVASSSDTTCSVGNNQILTVGPQTTGNAFVQGIRHIFLTVVNLNPAHIPAIVVL